ncbi:hypothetical protein [Halosimplex amylolyticum]|uniref:hypothetical protein n=1 Tax=Halosimplex amylolyticum TaxID=3396616 RepID=UPI003F548F5E
MTATTEHFSTYTVFDNQQWLDFLQHRNDILSMRPNGTNTERIENWTFESMPSSIAASNWSCNIEPRSDGFKDEPANGDCEIESDRDSIRVLEKTNRERYLNRSQTLPDDGPLFVKVKVTAHVQSSWSHSAAVLTVTSEGEETDIYRLETDTSSSSKTRTATRRLNITEYAGENVTVSLRADARHTGGDNSWLRAHYVDFEAPTEEVVQRDSDGDGIPDFREVTGIPLANGDVVYTDPLSNDTDGDGLEDGEEVDITSRVTQEPPNSQALETGYRWSSNPALGHKDTDGDGLTDSTELDGWRVPTINRSGTAYQYAPRDANGSIAVSSDPSDADSDSDGVTDYAEKFRTHTDPSGDVRYAIAGTLVVSEYADTLDHDQDGFPDELEIDGIATQVNGEFTRIETDLLSPDTDDDELHEAEEFRSREVIGRDVGPTEVQMSVFPLISDPTKTDSDGDGLYDLTEHTADSDPLLADSDGDKIGDFRDKNPMSDDSPPAVQFDLEKMDRIGGFFRITDDSEIASIDVKAHYPGVGWKLRPEAEGTIEEDERYSFGVGTHNAKKADKYWVNITDTNGNTASYLFEFEVQGGDIARTAVVTGSGLAVSTDPYIGDNLLGGAIAIGGIIFIANAAEHISDVEKDQIGSFLAAEPVNQWEGTVVGHVTLRPGFAETANGQTWGRGWAYIQATSGVTQDQIGDILQNGEHVAGEGAVDYVIGQAGERAIILTIIGGTLMAASQTAYDECSETTVDLDETDDWQYSDPNKPNKPFDGDKSAVRSAFEEVVTVFKGSNGKWYHIIKVGPNRFAIAVTLAKSGGSGKFYRYLQTFLTNIENGQTFFENLKDAEDYIEDEEVKNYDKVDCK